MATVHAAGNKNGVNYDKRPFDHVYDQQSAYVEKRNLPIFIFFLQK